MVHHKNLSELSASKLLIRHLPINQFYTVISYQAAFINILIPSIFSDQFISCLILSILCYTSKTSWLPNYGTLSMDKSHVVSAFLANVLSIHPILVSLATLDTAAAGAVVSEPW